MYAPLSLALRDHHQGGGGGSGGPSLAIAAMDDGSKVRVAEGAFLFALVWSAGCTADGAGRDRFNTFMRCAWLLAPFSLRHNQRTPPGACLQGLSQGVHPVTCKKPHGWCNMGVLWGLLLAAGP